MNKFQKLVDKSGMTYNQLAKKSGVDHAAIYRLKNGQTKDIALSKGFKIADALNIDVNELRGAFNKEE